VEKNELPQTVKLVYNAELNCMVDVIDNRYVQGIDSGVEYRKVLSHDEDDAIIKASAEIRELIFNDYPESQGGMVGSPVEVLLCALDWIKKRKVGEEESEKELSENLDKWLKYIYDNKTNVISDGTQLARKILETYELHRKEGK